MHHCDIACTNLTHGLFQIQKTQKAIKYTLTERYYAWEDALKLARADPEIELEAGARGELRVRFEPTDETQMSLDDMDEEDLDTKGPTVPDPIKTLKRRLRERRVAETEQRARPKGDASNNTVLGPNIMRGLTIGSPIV